MQLEFTQEEQAFRQEVRAFLQAKLPERLSRKMLEFIGLPWDARCLDFHQTARTVRTASSWQVRQTINKSSVERWRNYEQFVGPLLPLMDTDTVDGDASVG